MKATYETLTPQEQWLPPPESPLPALLALRDTDKCIRETQECISQAEVVRKNVQQRLEKEQTYLGDAKLMQTDMKQRISALQSQIEKQTQRTPEEAAKDLIQSMTTKQEMYEERTGDLVQIFNEFIEQHLAPLLAAEELGGPTVGKILDVDEAMLEAGFSAQGKAKRLKPDTNGDKRQRRIDDLWGPRPDEEDEEMGDEPWNEKNAAGREMRELTGSLLTTAVEPDGGGSGAYLDINKESASVRFLVRSKVAQYHPRNALKLRLVDFGGEVED